MTEKGILKKFLLECLERTERGRSFPKKRPIIVGENFLMFVL